MEFDFFYYFPCSNQLTEMNENYIQLSLKNCICIHVLILVET